MIISIAGGLGNQMFQYAYYLAQKQRYPEAHILADLSFFDASKIHNGYELKRIFGIEVEKCADNISAEYRVSNSLIVRLLRKFGMYYVGYHYTMRDKANGFDKHFMSNFKNEDYLFGFWQSEKYFSAYKDLIVSAFRFPEYTELNNSRLAQEMHSIDSVAIHVRRGDYLKNKMYVDLSYIGYYDDAIREIRRISINNRKWYIFSDDIEWCKNNLQLYEECVEYVSNNVGESSYRDMQLMTECKYLISANSSFSWWGAYLNKRAEAIIAPKNYYINNNGFNRDICPEKWIRI